MIEISTAIDGESDVATARRYAHPGLSEPVVRLVPEMLGEAEDLSLSYLGFGAADAVRAVGVSRRAALGFPAWAVVNDPANAHHALALVKDVERWTRTARTKPGAARDGFVELGRKLGQSAPHFLPTYYEQAGRAFLDNGNTTYAAAMFGKAREAEEVHSLAVSPDQLRQVFLEFAFAGALTAKALTQHARVLAATRSPADAYEEFSALCVERIRGGLAPHTGMAEDLRKLAKAAALDVAAADGELLRQIIGLPSIAKAASGFWKSYRPVLAAMDDPRTHAGLVAVQPEDSRCHDLWIGVLLSSGASALLTSSEGLPAGEPAQWLSRLARARTGDWRGSVGRSAVLLDLVSAMAGRLRADGQPVTLSGGEIDLDLMDLCLAEKIPLGSVGWANVGNWIADDGPGRRDLAAIAAGDQLAWLGERLATTHLCDQGALGPVLSTPGLRVALRQWLKTTAEQVHGGTLASIEQVMTDLRPLTSGVYVDVPEAVDWVATTDVARALADTLRGGIFDEYGWPALDEAVSMLLGTKKKPGTEINLVAGEGWPALVLSWGSRMLVVGPGGILLDHTLRPPKRRGGGDPSASYVDGRLLVVWPDWDRQLAYWSDAPDRVFPVATGSTDWPRWLMSWASLPVPGGGRFSGARVLLPGDTMLPLRTAVLGDGQSFWRKSWPGRWMSMDPTTGAENGERTPAWVDGYDGEMSWLRPAVEGTEAGPLGAAGGLLGWRARRTADRGWVGERIDGVRTEFPDVDGNPSGALRFPGDDKPRNIVADGDIFELFDAAGTRNAILDIERYRQEAAAGTALIPPFDWWHCLRIRDEAGSLALRSITPAMARDLLDGKEVGDVLPDVTHPELVAGIAGQLRRARHVRENLRAYRETMTASAVEAPVAKIGDAIVYNALRWSYRPSLRNMSATDDRILSGLAALGAAAKERSGRKIGDIEFDDWRAVLAHPEAVAWRAAAPFTPPEQRTALVAFLRTLAASGILAGGWHCVEATAKSDKVEDSTDDGAVLPTEDGFVVLWDGYEWRGSRTVWNGLRFGDGMPKGWKLRSAQPCASDFDIEGFCAELEKNGPIGWRPEMVRELSNRSGLSEGEAALLLAGLPGIRCGDAAFLDTRTRSEIGLSVLAAKSARERFRDVDEDGCFSLLDALVPENPADLWATGPLLGCAAELWVQWYGHRIPIPDDLLAEAAKQLPIDNSAEAVSAAVNPDASDWLTTDARMRFSKNGRMSVKDDNGLEGDQIAVIRNVVPWLAYRLPTGSPLREDLPTTLRLTRERLRHPEFFCDLGTTEDAASRKAVAALLRLPAEVVNPHDIDGWLRVYVKKSGTIQVYLRPSGYRDQHAEMLRALATLLSYGDAGVAEAIPVLLGEAIALEAQPPDPGRGASPPNPPVNWSSVTAGGDPAAYAQDPLLSVPDLVEAVAAASTVDSDVAALYLQLLALPDPTDANVARWTGWKPARLRAARTALAATDLVVSAKRARAGRSLFLPGGWLALASPHLPLESWKAPLFGTTEAVLCPLGTVEDLFRAAWRRIENGDRPAYEELRT